MREDLILHALAFLVYAASNAVMMPPRPSGPVGAPGVFGSVADFGRALFTRQLLPFEVTALVLMVAVIGVITLGGEVMTQPGPARHEARVERSIREAILREGND